MSVQQFCLRWNNHQPNFISVCSSLLHNGTLVDVTLAAEGRQLQAHKIVLSACSSYFQTLFTTNPCQHPIVILKDVQYDDLKTMVDFMYYGEVNVSQEQLPHILKTAEMLKIKGLAEMPTDAATLTKSDSKSSSDQPDQLQSSGTDSLWGSSESQFQQQQQPQQHHHHHHHQQSQTQQMHQLRRSPSPLGTGTSPAARRKRLRKSSNNGSGDRITEDHSGVDTGGNINLSQMSQMSFGGNTGGLGHTLHTKIIKESASVDVDTHQQDSSPDSLDDGHGHPHTMQIKPEADLSVPQTLPLDISGGTTPSEHDGPNASCSQSSHSGLQWTVVDSNYSRFSLSSCQPNLIGNGNTNNPNGGLSNQSTNNNGNQNTTDHQQQQQQQHRQQQQQQQQNANNSNGNSSATSGLGNTQQQPQHGHIQMHYTNSSYSPQIISVNSLVGSYSQNLSTPTSPNESAMVQSVYSQGPTPTQSPVHQMNTVPTGLTSTASAGNTGSGSGAGSNGGGNNTGNGTSLGASASSVVNTTSGNSATGVASNSQVHSGNQTTQTAIVVKRKRSVNPQGDENFIRALEAVRNGGIGFCKAARLYGVNNRTLWLEYKKRGYPISRPSIKSRVVKLENLSPSPTPTNEETTIENYEHINQSAINMQVPPTSDTPTPLMCTPHTHPMGVMGFLDTRHMDFPTSIHTMSRQRYVDSAVNVNPSAMNLQSINFNSI